MGQGRLPQTNEQLIDLLEVFHARTMRSKLHSEIRRLREEFNFLPGQDGSRRQEVAAYYENMLLVCTQLLQHLGDYD